MTTLNIQTFNAEAAWADAAARLLADGLASTPRPAVFAAAGGTTPAPILERLARSSVSWRGVSVVPTDDRIAPDDHTARTWPALARLLPAAAVTPLEAASDATLPGIVLLGFGADRHIASVFPAGEGMARAATGTAAAPTILRVTPEPLPAEAPFSRITFTLGALAAASVLVIAARGAAKAQTFAAAEKEAPASSPLARLLRARTTAGATGATHVMLLAEP